MVVFDRDLKRTQRDRAAAFGEASSFEYLHTEVATRVIDRLDDISRTFEGALDLGCGSGHMLAALADAGRRASDGWERPEQTPKCVCLGEAEGPP